VLKVKSADVLSAEHCLLRVGFRPGGQTQFADFTTQLMAGAIDVILSVSKCMLDLFLSCE
jgi:hypothetical protein